MYSIHQALSPDCDLKLSLLLLLFAMLHYFFPEYLERKRESAVPFLLSSTSAPLNPGWMEVSLVISALPQMKTSGWKESEGWTRTILMKTVSLNLASHSEMSFSNGEWQLCGPGPMSNSQMTVI
jgi:hypothetical protein